MRERIRRGRRRALACALALGLAPVVGLPTGPAAALQPLFEPELLPAPAADDPGWPAACEAACPCADWSHFCERQGDGEGRLSSIVFCCVT